LSSLPGPGTGAAGRPGEPAADAIAGARPAAPDELEGGFSRKAVAWLAGAAAASLAAAALVTAFGNELARQPSSRPDTWSEGALGHRALFELLAREGLGVVTRQSRAGMGIGPRRPLVLAEPDGKRGESRTRPSGDSPYLRDALARHAAVAVVLPKWSGEPDPAHPGWVAAIELLSTDEVLGRVERALGAAPGTGLQLRRQGACAAAAYVEGAAGGAWSPRIELGPAQLIAPDARLRPLVTCRGGWLAALRPASAAAPAMLLIADPDLLNNQGLGRADHAAVALRLLTGELRARGVVFDETIHGYQRSTGLLAEALRLPLLPATLHGLLVAGLVVWSASARFGKPLPALLPPARGKAVLIDNTAELLLRGGHAADTLARYYRYTLQAVGAHYFLPADLPPAELAARLDRLALPAALGRPPGPGSAEVRGRLARLERRMARLAGAAAGRRGEERAAALARELYRWRQEMMDGTRQGR
jgi:hypothetical protein